MQRHDSGDDTNDDVPIDHYSETAGRERCA